MKRKLLFLFVGLSLILLASFFVLQDNSDNECENYDLNKLTPLEKERFSSETSPSFVGPPTHSTFCIIKNTGGIK